MRLADEHFIFPEALPAAEVIRRIQNVFLNPAMQNQAFWLDQKNDWANAIYYICLEYWINPIWLLVCLQRERSLFGQVADERDFDFALGYVGQHGPGSKNETWNGLTAQLTLGARSSAWSLGLRPSESFRRGGPAGKLPSWDRWKPGVVVSLLSNTAPYPVAARHPSKSPGEHVQLVFTPREDWEALLDKNGAIYQKWIAPFYC